LNNFFFLSSDPAKFERMVDALVYCVEKFDCLHEIRCIVCSAAPFQKDIICLDRQRWWRKLALHVGDLGGQEISTLQVKKLYMITRLSTVSLLDSNNGAEDKLNTICSALGITTTFEKFAEFRKIVSAILRSFNAQQKLPIFPLTKKRPNKVIDSFVLLNYISV